MNQTVYGICKVEGTHFARNKRFYGTCENLHSGEFSSKLSQNLQTDAESHMLFYVAEPLFFGIDLLISILFF